MADKIIAADPEKHGAAPVKGNYTTDAETHIWCAEALAMVMAWKDVSFGELPADVQDALRHDAARLARLIGEGAQVLVCGGRDMAAGVSAALTEILAPMNLSPATLKAQNRYVEDVY